MATCLRLIDEIYARLRSVSILTNEVTRSLVPSQRTSSSIQMQETAQGKLIKFQELQRQSDLVMDSILQYKDQMVREEESILQEDSVVNFKHQAVGSDDLFQQSKQQMHWTTGEQE